MQGFYTERPTAGLCNISEISEKGGEEVVIIAFNTDFYFRLIQLYVYPTC